MTGIKLSEGADAERAILSPMTSSRPARDQSLDSFRGTDVLLMILVNVQGKDDDAFGLLKHAEWNGLTFADLVFPVFLLIVGLSAPLALDRPGVAISWPAILRRTFLLFMIGVGLSWLIKPTLDPEMIRWTGVLQRIAIVYLVCAIVIVARRGIGLAAGLAALLLAFHSYFLLRVGSPAGGGPSMEPGMGISGWLDQNVIPGRVLRKTWEPEGVLSTLPAIANGLIGVVIMRWMQSKAVSNAKLAMAGGVLLIAGLALAPMLPINKNLWTASFALVTCGIGALVWAALRMAWRSIGQHVISRWTVTLGQAALTLYVVHTLLIAIIVRKLPSGEKIWDVTYQALASTGLHPGIASLLYACAAAAISCTILPWLKRRGWILKV
jgi:predicted acyltransferase